MMQQPAKWMRRLEQSRTDSRIRTALQKDYTEKGVSAPSFRPKGKMDRMGAASGRPRFDPLTC
jgi:hypothetical protein